MSSFVNLRATPQGAALLAQVHAGTASLDIKSVVIGSGAWSADEEADCDLLTLKSQEMELIPSGGVQSGGQATLNVTLSNADLDMGFNFTEIGVVAEVDDGQGGKADLLYMADYVPIEKASWVPSGADYPVELPFNVHIACSSDYEVHIHISSTVPVTVEDLAAHNADPSAHTDIRVALGEKANKDHGHGIVNISGLQSALDNKANNNHGHGIVNISGLQSALDDKANNDHGHGIADVSGLQTALNWNFILEDSEGTEQSITQGREIKFVEGGGVWIRWTDTSNGSDSDPFDLTFGIRAAVSAKVATHSTRTTTGTWTITGLVANKPLFFTLSNEDTGYGFVFRVTSGAFGGTSISSSHYYSLNADSYAPDEGTPPSFVLIPTSSTVTLSIYAISGTVRAHQ